MAFTTWADGDVITAAKLNNDNTYAVGVDTARTVTAAHTWNATQTFGANVVINAGTMTTDVNAVQITQTWNNSGVSFTALEVNVTNTTSATSYLADFQVGGTTQWRVSKVGNVEQVGYLQFTTASAGGVEGAVYKSTTHGLAITGVSGGTNAVNIFSDTGGSAIRVPATTANTVLGGTLLAPTTVGVGAATPAASGAGITFPATQSASTDVNTLDDYEEGTWTPGVSFGGGTTGITYAAANGGSYTKIGRLVYITGRLILTSKGSSTGTALITGLPFAISSNATNYPPGSLWMDAVSFANFPMLRGESNSTTASLNEITDAGTRTVLDDTNFANASEVHIALVYQIA